MTTSLIRNYQRYMILLQRPSNEIPLDNDQKDDTFKFIARNWQMRSYHPKQQITGDVHDKVLTISTFKNKRASCTDF
ncbi:hypothetical protein CR513_18426, partial [Mucuna pruriens]